MSAKLLMLANAQKSSIIPSLTPEGQKALFLYMKTFEDYQAATRAYVHAVAETVGCNNEHDDVKDVRQALGVMGLGVPTDTVVIDLPDDLEVVTSASEVRQEFEWPDPFIAKRIDTLKMALQGNGDQEIPSCMASGISKSALIHGFLAEGFKQRYPVFVRAHRINAIAHELTHCAGYNITNVNYFESDGRTIRFDISQGLGQCSISAVHSAQQFVTKPYTPQLFEEMHANFRSNAVRRTLLSETRPDEKIYIEWDAGFYGGPKDLGIDADFIVADPAKKTFVPTTGYPAAMLLDLLTWPCNKPELLQNINDVINGDASHDHLVEFIKEYLGDELATDLLARQPYDKWYDFYCRTEAAIFPDEE